jgi:hypothetical protein
MSPCLLSDNWLDEGIGLKNVHVVKCGRQYYKTYGYVCGIYQVI